jgi:hypothetical protein
MLHNHPTDPASRGQTPVAAARQYRGQPAEVLGIGKFPTTAQAQQCRDRTGARIERAEDQKFESNMTSYSVGVQSQYRISSPPVRPDASGARQSLIGDVWPAPTWPLPSDVLKRILQLSTAVPE